MGGDVWTKVKKGWGKADCSLETLVSDGPLLSPSLPWFCAEGNEMRFAITACQPHFTREETRLTEVKHFA